MSTSDTNTQRLGIAQQYHKALPGRIRRHLNARGIPDAVIDHHLLGWNGRRITIPVFGREGELSQFRYARDPRDNAGPKVLTEKGTGAELYGWERIRERARQLVVCEGEFDRLVLEARGIPAVTSTGGAGTFLSEWAEALRAVPDVYVCFDRDKAGRAGAKRVCKSVPGARLVKLPKEVGKGGDVTDFFVRLKKSRGEFMELLGKAKPLPSDGDKEESDASPATMSGAAEGGTRTPHPDPEIRRLKERVRLEELAAQYLDVRSRGWRFRARCPFHDDGDPSFVVFPESQTFHCFGCQAHGDVIDFLMRMEHLTFGQALEVLRALEPTP